MFDWLKKRFLKKTKDNLEESAPIKKKEIREKFFDARTPPESKDLRSMTPDERLDYIATKWGPALKAMPDRADPACPPPFVPEEIPEEDPVDNVLVIDLRDEQPDPPPPVRGKNKWRIRGGKVAKRRPSDVTGITVHQTAARFGVSDAAIRAAGGDRTLALARRSKGVACHVMAFADGFVAWPNPLDWYVWHGNGFNSDTLGIEIDGDFAGLESDKSTAFRKKTNPDKLTPELLNASKRAIKLLVEEGRKQGMPIKYIYAHRQSSTTRRSDPGEEIWKKVVLDYAVKELGLITRPDHIELKGYSIPKEWDPNASGEYWDDPVIK